MLTPSYPTRSPAASIDHVLEGLTSHGSFPVCLPIQQLDTDPLLWLDAQPFTVKLVWSDRHDSNVIAGAGAAATIDVQPGDSPALVVDACRKQLQENAVLRFYGGLSFDSQCGWEAFGAGRFVAPRFLLQNGQLNMTVMSHQDVGQAKEDLQQLHLDVTTSEWPTLPTPIATRFAPTQDGWLSTVDEALTLIRSEVLEKIVLARKTTLEFDAPITPWNVAAKLNDATYDCFLFGFQFDTNQAFVGATPECLFRRDGQRLRSEVIAGTRPRGLTSGEDQRLAYDLLTSEKDELEHDIVRKSIRQKLHKYVEHLSVDTHASVLRLAHKQHLCSSVEGELKSGVDEGALLERLHPTPAVGGYPTENALPEIARLEPFNRGWYAAPVGWIGADSAEFVVGIRSGLVQEKKLSLYSGAGIVRGSDPQQEWAEVDNKIRGFLDLFADQTLAAI